MTVLVVGIILIALLVGVSLLQWLLRRRQVAIELNYPHVSELAALALTPAEFPNDYDIDYRGPVTNERLARGADNEAAALDEFDQTGRVIGYRQAFRNPRSRGELVDVILNNTTRKGMQQRLLAVDISLFEDAAGAAEATDETPPDPTDTASSDGSLTIRVSDVGEHNLAFAQSVRQWSRLAADGTELQRKIEVRWQDGLIGGVVAGDSEPPGGVSAEDVCRLARIVHDRVAASPLVGETVPASAP